MFLSRKSRHRYRSAYAHHASMGPGCFYPGNSRRTLAPGLALSLQWGPDVSIPEICVVRGMYLKVSALQWGRDVSIPEMDRPGRGRPRLRASMGPGCFRSEERRVGEEGRSRW